LTSLCGQRAERRRQSLKAQKYMGVVRFELRVWDPLALIRASGLILLLGLLGRNWC